MLSAILPLSWSLLLMIDENKQETIRTRLLEILPAQTITEEKVLRVFSKDQSIYEILPLAAVVPASVEDIPEIITLCRDEQIPLTPRGGGSGTAGSALGSGIVIALPPKNNFQMIQTLRQSEMECTVSVGAGTYHADVQKFLRARSFYLPADPSSSKICQIGGNVATKASGPHAYRHGSIDRYIEGLEFFTNQGEFVNTMDPISIPARIRAGLEAMEQKILAIDSIKKILLQRKNQKIASGYNLFPFLDSLDVGTLLSRVLAGSVGTLGYVTGVTLRARPYIPLKAAVLFFVKDLQDVGDIVQHVQEFDVAAIEIMNKQSIKLLGAKIPSLKNNISYWRDDGHLLLVELEGVDSRWLAEKIAAKVVTSNGGLVCPPVVAYEEEEIDLLWHVRKQIYPFLMNLEPHRKALSVVNDVGVPSKHLAAAITAFQEIFHKYQLEALIYGHAGSGNLHLRPLFDLHTPHLKGFIEKVADEVYQVVLENEGTITAEHGMGRIRAPYLMAEWGEEIYGIMQELKTIFDPDDFLNPGVMFNDEPITSQISSDLLRFQ